MPRKNFSLENSLYTKKFINRTIKDFWEAFAISYKDNLLSIEAGTEEEVQEIFHEFMNYVIGLHNETL